MQAHEFPLRCVCGHRTEDGADSAQPGEPVARIPRMPKVRVFVGRELEDLLRSLGITAKLEDDEADEGCGCKELARKMDQWGIAGCRRRRCEIAAKLQASAAKESWWTIIKATTRAVTSGVAFLLDPADPFGALVDEAIRRAEAKVPDVVIDTRWRIIPRPPPLNLSPRSRRAVVTAAVGSARQLLSVTQHFMRVYAERIGADFVVLDWHGVPDWPLSVKFQIGRVLDYYERVAFLDADVLPRYGCVDLFSLCEQGEFGFVDELEFHARQPRFRCIKRYMDFRDEMGFRKIDGAPWMLNSGVMVVPRSHKHLFDPPTVPMKTDHVAEQNWIMAGLLDSGLPYKLLPRKCNWQRWTDTKFAEAPHDAILHWSGMKNGRVEAIRDWVAKTPEMDARHRDWIARTVMSGRFRRVLEIGSYRGFSARALLDALKAGKIHELHLCDANPRPELRQLIEGVPGVTLHHCLSTELLARDAAWDLVVLDGHHERNPVEDETRLMLAAGVRAVFAHDSAAHPRYPMADGLPILKERFAAAGYSMLEDALPRVGEQTDRGLLFCAKDGADFAAGASALHLPPQCEPAHPNLADRR